MSDKTLLHQVSQASYKNAINLLADKVDEIEKKRLVMLKIRLIMKRI